MARASCDGYLNLRLAWFLVLGALAGCPFPALIVAPLRTTVIDADTGAPVAGADVLQVVCDVHDFDCDSAKMFRTQTDADGRVDVPGERQWGVWFPAPGGMLAPNHQIAIWKEGYRAFVFSQYGDLAYFMVKQRREEVAAALREVPDDRDEYSGEDDVREQLIDGSIRLRRSAAGARR